MLLSVWRSRRRRRCCGGCAQQYSLDQPGGPRFARDSLLEEDGFELLVPPRRNSPRARHVVSAHGSVRDQVRDKLDYTFEATRVTQIPPGSARASIRAATFTPSPKMSCSSTITSPRLIPTRNPDPALFRQLRLALGHPPLHLDRAPDGVDHARKLRQQAVAGVLYGSPPVLLDFGRNELPEMRLQPFVRPLLIRPHQARVSRHVGGEDRNEAADRRHFSRPGLTLSSLPRNLHLP